MQKNNLLLGIGLLALSPLHAAELTFTPSKDNTLYDSDTGALSNGSGEFLFVGKTVQNDEELRRALLAFDVASRIPAGSTVSDASLQLTMSRTIADVQPVTVHQVLADWGEGASDAAGREGSGTTPMMNDATWTQRFFNADPAMPWSSPGGDFAATALATLDVGGSGDYVWQSTELTASVQSWLDMPAENFGWLLQGTETTSSQQVRATAKRFNSRENPATATVPQLRVVFAPAVSARFSISTGILDIFILTVDSAGQFQVSLQQSMDNPLAFTLENVAVTTDSADMSGLFSLETGILQLPQVEVVLPDNTTTTISAEFQWQMDNNPATFTLTAAQ